MVPKKEKKKIDELDTLIEPTLDIASKLGNKMDRDFYINTALLGDSFGRSNIFTNDYIKLLDEYQITQTDVKRILLWREAMNLKNLYSGIFDKERYDIFDTFYKEFKKAIKDLNKRAKRIAKEEGIEI